MEVSAKGVSAMALRCEVCNVSFLLFCMFVHLSKMPWTVKSEMWSSQRVMRETVNPGLNFESIFSGASAGLPISSTSPPDWIALTQQQKCLCSSFSSLHPSHSPSLTYATWIFCKVSYINWKKCACRCWCAHAPPIQRQLPLRFLHHPSINWNLLNKLFDKYLYILLFEMWIDVKLDSKLIINIFKVYN